MNTWHQHAIRAVSVCLICLLGLAAAQSLTQAATNDLLISEYIEGSSNNKAIELYNGTGAPIDLGAGSYQLQFFFNGAAIDTTPGTTINLMGTVADGDVFVVADDGAVQAILDVTDQTSTSNFFNGDDAIVLRHNGAIIDVIGQIGFDPGSEWGSGLVSTQDNTLRRLDTVCTGDPDGLNAFDPSLEWEGLAQDTFDGLGSHTANCDGSSGDNAPAVTSIAPNDGTANVPVNSTITVNFSEAVDLSADAITIECPTGAPVTFTGLPEANVTSVLLTPAANLPINTTCTVTVVASQVSDTDAIDPPDRPEADAVASFTTGGPLCGEEDTPIGAIQGTGTAPAITTPVTVQGVVVGDYEGPSPTLRGFYLQDSGDGNPESSDAIFVFNNNNDSVSLGEVVQLSATPSDFQDQTQLGNITQLVHCGVTGAVEPVELTLPFPASVNGVPYLERFEGMLVKLPQTLYVTEFFQLGRFGQVVVSSGDRLYQPTNLFPPGSAGSAQLQQENDLNRIILDDDLNNQNPDPILFARDGQPLTANNTLRGGDTVENVVGILTYTWAGNSASGNAYRVRPINALGGGAPDFQAVNERPTAAPEVGGSLKVASFNVLNYFVTVDAGPDVCGPAGDMDCRGADSEQEFTRQRDKMLQALSKLNADVVGLIELENAPNAEPLADIVDGLNTLAGANIYAYVNTGVIGTDAIKVGLLYKPATVTPINGPLVDTDPIHNRPPVAQLFENAHNGSHFSVVVNHFKSKGSCPAAGTDPANEDSGDGQSCWNGVRVQQATRLLAFINETVIPAADGDADVLIIGDLNSYAKEDPITTLENAGYTNLVERFGGAGAYSYVFDGQWGYLDHALASPSLLSQIQDVADYHINADEPSVLDYNVEFKSAGQIDSLYAPDEYRTSDHDPVLIGLELTPPALIYVSGATAGYINDANDRFFFTDEDIVLYDEYSKSWSKFFDASDLGLILNDLEGFYLLDEEGALPNILMTFALPRWLPNVGWVFPNDIVKFTPTSLGSNSSGSFAIYLDGSDVGLTTLGEGLDAISMSPDGRLVVSTAGNFAVPGTNGVLRGQDKDLLVLNNGSFGANSSGVWSLYLDGSAVGLNTGAEDLWAAYIAPNGELYLSTLGGFAVSGASGNGNEIFICTPGNQAPITSCAYRSYLSGSSLGFNPKIDGLFIGEKVLSPAAATGATAETEAEDLKAGDRINDAEAEDIAEGADEQEFMLENIFMPLIVQ
ncbi:MAG: ExeM/NucH family extracellular endonuclease [Caldilineaceae bacterium]